MGGDNQIRRTNNPNKILFNHDTKLEFELGSDRTKRIKNLRKVCPFTKHKLRKAEELLRTQELLTSRSEKEKPIVPVKNDENWSLEDLLSQDRSRPGTGTGTGTQELRHSKSEILENRNYSSLNSRDESEDSRHDYNRRSDLDSNQLKRLYDKGDGWMSSLRTPLPPLDDSETDSEDERLLFGRRQSSISSSGSSMSWAEDAFENGQTDELKNLWRDIEHACEGNGKADGMSDLVYEECLEWRRAFPAECSAPSRFKFMMDLDAEDEDSTPTPTNELSIREQFSALDQSLPEFRADNCSTPNPDTSTEYVSSWLSQCQISEEGSKVDELSGYGDERISSSNSISRFPRYQNEKLTESNSWLDRNTENSTNLNRDRDSRTYRLPKLSSRSAYPTRHRPSALSGVFPEPEVKEVNIGRNSSFEPDSVPSQTQFSTNRKTRVLSSASWSRYSNNPNLANSSSFQFPVGQENLDADDERCDRFYEGESERKFGSTNQTQRPSFLPLLSRQQGTYNNRSSVRNNVSPKPVKPFMFWLFNNTSPS